MYCGSCGFTGDDDDSFCSECGELFTIPPVTAVVVPMTTAVVPAQPMSAAPTWAGPVTYAGTPTGTYGPTSTYGPPAQLTGRFLDPVTGAPLASWGRRLAARLLDGLILGIPSTVAWIIFLVTLSHSLNNTSQYGTASTNRAIAEILFGWFALPLIFNLLAFAYYICFIGGSKGQTLGMRIVSIQVRDAFFADKSIGFGRSFMRSMVQVTFGILFVPLVLDYLAPLWTPRRQCWHDMAVSSIVVETV